jgi:hypothetical protein
MMRRLFAFWGDNRVREGLRTPIEPATRGGGVAGRRAILASFRRAQRPERFSVTASPKETWLAERFESR